MGDRIQPPPHRGDQRRRQDRHPRRRSGGTRGPRARRGGNTARSGPPRSAASAGNNPPRRPDGQDRGHQRTRSADHQRARRSARPAPGPHHHRPDRCLRRVRLPAEPLSELGATKQALRSHPRRIKALAGEVADLQASIRRIVEIVAPQLLDQPGVGPISAAQIYISWSHPGRCRNEAAFARLAGVAPLEASSGQNTRHRLCRRGDRQLNRALRTIAITRIRTCPASTWPPPTNPHQPPTTHHRRPPRTDPNCAILHSQEVPPDSGPKPLLLTVILPGQRGTSAHPPAPNTPPHRWIQAER